MPYDRNILFFSKEDLEDYWFINHLCVAHLAATTICLGVFLTTQDCLFKLFYLYFKLVGGLYDENPDPSYGDRLPDWVKGYKEQVEQEREMGKLSKVLYIYLRSLSTKFCKF